MKYPVRATPHSDIFKNDLETRDAIFPKYEPVVSHGDPINAQSINLQGFEMGTLLELSMLFWKRTSGER